MDSDFSDALDNIVLKRPKGLAPSNWEAASAGLELTAQSPKIDL